MSEGRRMKSNSGNSTDKTKGRKRNSKLDAILKLIAFIYAVITIIFYISVIKMDMLPGMYVTIFTVAEIIFTIAMVIGLVKRHRTYTLNIVCLLVIIFISSIYIYVTNYALATSNFLDNILKEVSETEEYYVVVKKDSNYSKIEDIKNQDVYLFQAEDDIKSEVGSKISITLKSKNSLQELGESLINNNIEAILISSTQYDILDEEVKNFKANTKIIYTATHKIKVKTEVVNANAKNTIENGIFNVYISGIDTSGSISNVARSDANIIATVNTKTHEVLLTSIPRDYYVTLHSKGAKDKLTHSGIYGISETVSTVEDLLNIDINYYVRVNFTTVIKVVDTLGGIDVYSDYDFTGNNGTHFTKGYNHVNGEDALSFSRERYSFTDGDNQRVKNQQHVIEAIMKKVLNSTTLLTKYTSILNSLEGSFQTNIKQEEISSLVKGQLNDMSSWTIKNNSLTGTGATSTTYSMGSQKLYVMIPSSTSVQEAKEKIADVMGE